MRTTTAILAACLCVPLAGPALAQGTAITPGQSLANQPGAAAPAPAATAAPAEAPPKPARTRKASAKKAAKKPAAVQ